MTRTRLTLAVIGCVVGAQVAHAQTSTSGMHCIAVAEPGARTAYQLDVGGALAGTGCRIQTPPRLMCAPAMLANVVPVPPDPAAGAGPSGPALCYKLKCPPAPSTFRIRDQFGDHHVRTMNARLLCVPADVPTAPIQCQCAVAGGSTTTVVNDCVDSCDPQQIATLCGSVCGERGMSYVVGNCVGSGPCDHGVPAP